MNFNQHIKCYETGRNDSNILPITSKVAQKVVTVMPEKTTKLVNKDYSLVVAEIDISGNRSDY